MTEIQIKNLIKEYEKEYIEFMEIEKLPQYKIDFFWIVLVCSASVILTSQAI